MFHLESLVMIMAYCRKQGTRVLATACIENEFDPSLMVSKLLDVSRSTNYKKIYIYIYIKKLTCSSGIIHHFYLFGPRDGRDCGSDGLGLSSWTACEPKKSPPIGCWLMGPVDPFEWHGKTMENHGKPWKTMEKPWKTMKNPWISHRFPQPN